MGAQPIEYYTYDDYLQWEGNWEIIDGVAYAMVPAPMFNHQLISFELGFLFKEALKECPCFVLGEEDYKINDFTVVRPDVVIVCERFTTHIDKPPKLIAEVISPSSRFKDEEVKFRLYEQEGVDYYILVDLEKESIRCYHNSPKGFLRMQKPYTFTFDSCEAQVDLEKVFEILKEPK